MEAGVVVVHPADQPDGDVVVAEELLVARAARVVVDGAPRAPAARRGLARTPGSRSRPRGPRSCRHRGRAERRWVGSAVTSPAAAPRTARSALDHRPVGAVEEPVDAHHANHRVDRARAVRGRVEDTSGSCTPGRAAARGEPLGVQRRQPGEHREHDGRCGCAARPQTGEGVPRPTSRRRSGSRPDTTRGGGARPRRGPGWTSSGAPPSCRQRARGAAHRGPGAPERARRQRRHQRRRRSRRSTSSASGSSSATAPHRPNGSPSSSTPAWKASSSGRPRRRGAPRCPAGSRGETTRSNPSARTR